MNNKDENQGKFLGQEVDATAQSVVKEGNIENTYGARAVGLDFNPSKTDEVYDCKHRFACSINQLHDRLSGARTLEEREIIEYAIRQIQTAQMWAVKVLTWRN